MNGRQLAEKARKDRPDLKVLFTTGHARNAIVHEGRLDPGVELLTKPFTQAALIEKLRDILDAKSMPARVLVEEDEPLIRMMVVEYLEETGVKVASMHTQSLQLVAPRIGERRFVRIRHHDRRAVRGVKSEKPQSRRNFGRLREHRRYILRTDCLDIGDLPVAQLCKRLRRYARMSVDLFIHDTRLLDFANVVESCAVPLLVLGDCYRLNRALRFGTRKINRQQPVPQVGSQHLHPVRQHESALELAGRNTAVEKLPGLFVVLPAADDELILLDRYVEFGADEARHGQRDTQPLLAAALARHPLDIVGRIAVGGFGNPVERAFDFIKAEQERTR
jgi:CheY-like chemotaxis protein